MNNKRNYFSISWLLTSLISLNISAQSPILVNTDKAAPGAGLTVNGAVVILREDQVKLDLDNKEPVFEINQYGKEVTTREPRTRRETFDTQYLNEKFNVTNPLLFVDGLVTKRARIYSSDIKWADYVFEKGYELMSLNALEDFVTEYKHLPAIPSASEVMTNGYSSVEMQHNFLKTIEELTLHQTALNKEIEELKLKNSKFKEIAAKVNKLKAHLGITTDTDDRSDVKQITQTLGQSDQQVSKDNLSANKPKVGANVAGLENNTVLNVSGRMVISNYDGAIPNLDESMNVVALASYEDDLNEREIEFPKDENGNTLWEDQSLRNFDIDDFLVFVNGETVATDYVSTYLAEEWDPQDVDLGWIDHPLPMGELEEFIEKNGHLPGIPSQQDITEWKGYEVNAMNLSFKKTIENQFEYLIQQTKALTEMKGELEVYINLENELASIKDHLAKQ